MLTTAGALAGLDLEAIVVKAVKATDLMFVKARLVAKQCRGQHELARLGTRKSRPLATVDACT